MTPTEPESSNPTAPHKPQREVFAPLCEYAPETELDIHAIRTEAARLVAALADRFVDLRDGEALKRVANPHDLYAVGRHEGLYQAQNELEDLWFELCRKNKGETTDK